MAIQQLSVYDNVAMIHEHSGAKRASRRTDVLGAIEFVGLELPPQTKVGATRRTRTAARRGRARRRRQAARGAARRAGGRPARRGDRPARRGDPEDPRAHGCARHPRRPRHDARLGVLRDDGRARLRAIDRLRPHRRRAAQRARHARVPRNRGQSCERRPESVQTTRHANLVLRLDDLSVSRAGRGVVHDVTLDIPAGQVTTLLGANGAGKSTLVLTVAASYARPAAASCSANRI